MHTVETDFERLFSQSILNAGTSSSVCALRHSLVVALVQVDLIA
jgi:hypothetical protein